MGILDGNQKHEPMHYGEIFAAWSYLSVAQSTFVENQVMINHTGDKDLEKFLEDYSELLESQISELSELLKKNGVTLPPAPPERPKVNLEDIPAGARLMDSEIANAKAALIATALMSCSTIMGIATREDIGIMFGRFHAKKAKFAGTLLNLLKEKCWLTLPPLHNPNGYHG